MKRIITGAVALAAVAIVGAGCVSGTEPAASTKPAATAKPATPKATKPAPSTTPPSTTPKATPKPAPSTTPELEGDPSEQVYGDEPLELGSRGGRVLLLQHNLNEVGIPCAVDGYFGPQTEAAVRTFQSTLGLVVDGVYGPQSEAAMAEVFAAEPNE